MQPDVNQEAMIALNYVSVMVIMSRMRSIRKGCPVLPFVLRTESLEKRVPRLMDVLGKIL